MGIISYIACDKQSIMDTKDIINQVEQIVCDKVGVDRDEMISITKKGACVKARHLIMFILHTEFNVSVKTLCDAYNYSTRGVFLVNQRVREYIAYNSTYRDFCNDVIDCVRTIEIRKNECI